MSSVIRYEYIVADLPHDFSDITLQTLDAADVILLVASPDMSSLRAAFAAIHTYKKLGYPKEKLKLILNATFPRSGLPKDKIESALGMQTSMVVPYTEILLVEAIKYGRPPCIQNPMSRFQAYWKILRFISAVTNIRSQNLLNLRKHGNVYIRDIRKENVNS